MLEAVTPAFDDCGGKGGELLELHFEEVDLRQKSFGCILGGVNAIFFRKIFDGVIQVALICSYASATDARGRGFVAQVGWKRNTWMAVVGRVAVGLRKHFYRPPRNKMHG